MSKLTVESIIDIYGSGVKEIKAYSEAKRAKAEEFLQVEPVAFSLSDEPGVLRIYIDKESTVASLDGTLKEDIAKFEAGKTYYSRSICDHECIFTIEVVKRTKKSVTYIYDGKQRRSMIKTDENGEYIKPDRYSMAPSFWADREVETKKAEEQTTEDQVAEVAKDIVDGIGKDLAAGLVEYYNLVKQLAEDIPGYKLGDTREIKRLLVEQLPEWDEEDWEDLRAAVEAESQRIWDKQEKTVTMTREQWNKLTCYLLMSTQHREKEAKAWAELSEEKAEDGSPKYKNAAGNAEYWREMVTDIEEIRKKIDEA